MKKLVAALFLVSLCSLAGADGKNYGGSSEASFIGVGARATGLGSAYVALADDATAPYWNPAGLGQMDLYLYALGFQYVLLPDSMYAAYASYAFQIPEVGSFSLAWNHFAGGESIARDEQEEKFTKLNSAENVFYLTYGRRTYEWLKGLYLGVNLKILQQNLANVSAAGHGLDVGAIWQPIMYLDHTIGLNIQNIYQRLYWQTQSNTTDATPMNLKAGVALKFLPSSDVLYYYHLLTTMDVDFSETSQVAYHVGAEYWYIQSIGARVGVNSQEVTVGATYKPDYYEVDYAFHYDLTEIANHQHRLSILLRLETAPLSGKPPVPGLPEVPEASQAAEYSATENMQAANPEDEGPMEEIPAQILEIQKVGGRANKVILNVGKNHGVRKGLKGVLLSVENRPIAGILILQVDPELSLAEVMGMGADVTNDTTAVVKKPVEK